VELAQGRLWISCLEQEKAELLVTVRLVGAGAGVQREGERRVEAHPMSPPYQLRPGEGAVASARQNQLGIFAARNRLRLLPFELRYLTRTTNGPTPAAPDPTDGS